MPRQCIRRANNKLPLKWKSAISTRKIERLAKGRGIENISASQVSQINKDFDTMVYAFRHRALDEEYPGLWIDALYEKIRNNTHVFSSGGQIKKSS